MSHFENVAFALVKLRRKSDSIARKLVPNQGGAQSTLYWLQSMRRFASIAALLLVLTTLAPMLACVTRAAMTREESACCKSMQAGGVSQCGQMAKMGCCRTEVRTDTTPQLASISPTIDFRPVVILALHSLGTPHPPSAIAPSQTPIEHFPPGLLTAKTAVLRI